MTVHKAMRAQSGADDFDRWVVDLRHRLLLFVLPSVMTLALLVLSSVTRRNNVLAIVGVTTALVALAGLAGFLRRYTYTAAVWSLVIGVGLITTYVATWSGLAPVICLLALPVGLATLLITRPAGAATAVVCTLWLALAPVTSLPAPLALRLTAGILVWAILGLLWLMLSPLLTAVQWAWSSYEQSYERLEASRAMQVRLHETLEDLTSANQQLMRLNRLAQGLRQLAEDERRAKEEFVAKVSHELRTPLNMIIGFCEMITQSPETYGTSLSQTLLADLDVVLRNSEHLSGLIDDVLDLSQIEAGQMALTKERVALPTIIEAAVVAVRPLYESKGLYLETDVLSSLPQIFCDQMRIREVILNLLSNAGRFTEQGGVRVRVWREGHALITSVADTGPGIADADRERLFQPFQQLDNTIRRRYGGTGLGLSISRSFVALHDGELWVESVPGEGTTFFFSLPIDPPAPLSRDDAVQWFNPYAPDEPRARARRLPAVTVLPRVVVVESAGEALQRLLRRYWDTLEVVGVPAWADACAEVAREPAQAILVNAVDVGAALQQIAQAPALPYDIPALVCSIPDVSQTIDALGVRDYLVKPITQARLLAALDDLDRPVETIMVVDDEPDALRLYWRMLASSGRGYRMMRANDGQQALALLRHEQPDVILLDLTMPGMDGLAFLAARADIPAQQEIPVMLMSARDPVGHAITSPALAVTCRDGIGVSNLLQVMQTLVGMLGVT